MRAHIGREELGEAEHRAAVLHCERCHLKDCIVWRDGVHLGVDARRGRRSWPSAGGTLANRRGSRTCSAGWGIVAQGRVGTQGLLQVVKASETKHTRLTK